MATDARPAPLSSEAGLGALRPSAHTETAAAEDSYFIERERSPRGGDVCARKDIFSMQRDITCLRNIGIMASVDAGSATCRERIFELADRLRDDRDRGHARRAAQATFPWPATMVSWTPRSGPFVDEATSVSVVDSPLRAIDGAVLILDGARGTGESGETIFRAARARGVPCVAFIDDAGETRDFEAMVAALESDLDVTAAVVYAPFRDERGAYVIDLLEQRLVLERDGARTLKPLPAAAREIAARMRRRIVDVCAEVDESIMGASAMGQDIGADELARALRKATIARGSKVIPVACGSLRVGRGVGLLLDAVVTYLPSPAERPPVFGMDPRRNMKVARFPRDEDALSAIVFATTHEPSLGDVMWLRILSGTLRVGAPLALLPEDARGKVERIHLPDRFGFEELEEAGPGSIVCASAFSKANVDDTLTDARAPVILNLAPSKDEYRTREAHAPSTRGSPESARAEALSAAQRSCAGRGA